MVKIDFCSNKMRHRLKHGGGRGEAIAKAVGLKSQALTIIDATTGLGSDSFILASLGCTVYMIERNPEVHQALQTALEALTLDSELSDIASRMHLHFGDAANLIPDLPQANVIYLDPMFPERQKSALVKKPLRDLRELVGDDEDAAALFDVAKRHAKKIVVKRPRLAPAITDIATNSQLIGKANRFDIYYY